MGSIVNLITILSVIQSLHVIDGAGARPQRVRDGDKPLPSPMMSSLFPLPNGPFYGFPFDAKATLTRNLPLTVAGTCMEGTIYNISKVDDLYNYNAELECVYSAGYAPTTIPEGTFSGKFMSMFNTDLFNNPSNALWQGAMITPVDCGDNKITHLGWNNVLGRPVVPFIATIRPVELNLAPGEYDDGKSSLVLDYTQDLRAICPDYRSFVKKNYQDLVIRRSSLNSNVYPFNQFVDTMRLVGKQEDGNSIYLGKSYFRDVYREDMQAATVAFWYVVHYDANSTTVRAGESLPPLEKTFKYMFPGIVDLPLRILPFDNLLTNPVKTIQKMIRGALNAGRNAIHYGGEIGRNFGNFGGNARRFREAFNAGRSG